MDVKCNFKDLFNVGDENTCLKFFEKDGFDNPANKDKLQIDKDELRECLRNGVCQLRYTGDGPDKEVVLADYCTTCEGGHFQLPGPNDRAGEKTKIEARSIFENLLRIMLDKKFGPDCGNSGHILCENDNNFAISFIDMLCEMQFKTTDPAKYNGYTDPNHKIVTDKLVQFTNDPNNRKDLSEAIKYKLDLASDGDDIEDKCIDVIEIIKQSTFTYCFKYRFDIKDKCENNYPDGVINNNCDNAYFNKEDGSPITRADGTGVIVCIKLTHGECCTPPIMP